MSKREQIIATLVKLSDSFHDEYINIEMETGYSSDYYYDSYELLREAVIKIENNFDDNLDLIR